ncbi:putative nuclease HARBI1 isoform X2 [Coccinella septempunctata]|uniref:putative nuclease HARBI1 isoform X2 n=2 Tax=Coccinella septempunctata TaxID=41139 RepID=UPI001D086172|nr:putative nuclease HARBI1 isoform X2 [Coccinella septempunctata]XP_044752008.1 putative nuclease HARBI1 isoform X2 [Coccinella septempunctata]XP_044753921.1 putative nuclease HARBI1 isoform X2 [Coccinella septempunctata]
MLSDTSSSSEENNEEYYLRRPRSFKNLNDPFEMYNDAEFKHRFRFHKNSVMELLHKIGEKIEAPTKRNRALNAKMQIIVALRFYATGGFQMTIGDHVNITKPTVCRIVKRVSTEIAKLKPNYISMPKTRQKRLEVASGFHDIAGLPRVVGAIDCTHIRIISPGGSNAETFRNRKGYFSINVQAVCDAGLKIINIIARWPGSVHDSTIFNDSPLIVEMEQGLYGNCYLLGDSGYACKPFLLTPVLNPGTEAERRYNQAHIKTRNCIERCFGVLKRRFPCLYFEESDIVHHDQGQQNTAIRNALIADLFERYVS